MTRIYKYQLTGDAQQTVMLEPSARIIHVGVDPGGNLCIWAEVDPRQTRVAVTIYTVDTGGAVPPGASHIGTHVGQFFVYHFYRSAP